MTREEEIKQAIEHNLDVSIYTPEDGEMLKEAFYLGARWADAHPKNVWNDASEKPHAKKWLLVQLDIDDYKILCLKDLYIDLWCDWCKIFNFIRWAYIEDLLPKGGEE